MKAARALLAAGALVPLVIIMTRSEPGPFSNAPPAAANSGSAISSRGIGAKAPLQFMLKDLNGADVTLDSFKGKVILLNFWATWCGPCRAEIPDLIELQRAHAQDLVVVGVVVMDRFGANVRRFASELEMNYPIVDATSRSDIEEAYGPMWGLPTTFVIARDGTIIKRRSGIGSKEQFERDVEALL